VTLNSPELAEPLTRQNGSSRPSNRRAFLLFATLQLFLTAGLIVYSQTMAFVWDEGFHLVAAKLINAGKRPYIDFCFPQTPLNAYWNAALLHVFGQSWRVTHVAAAMLVAAAAWLTGDYVLRRFPVPQWRIAGACLASSFVALNESVVLFGAVAQAYAAGLFLGVAAFRLAIVTPDRASPLLLLATGLLAGGAAGATLLTAPVVPLLLVWILLYSRTGRRLAKFLIFSLGVFISWLPVFWLWLRAPVQTWFNVVQYQALFRRVNWPGATLHDVEVFTAWLNSTEATLLGALALAGALFARKSSWSVERRREFYLCGWLLAGLVLYISTPHPTFQRYFLFAVPFAAMLAIPGLYWFTSRLWNANRPVLPSLAILVFLGLYVGRLLFQDRDATTWKDYEKVARKVDEVTPKGGKIYADELVYFLLNRPIPSGMEFSYSHKLELPAKQESLLHIVSERELNEQVKRGEFATVQSCKEDRIEEMKLPELFPYKEEFDDCTVFWGPLKRQPVR
jgi:4-amino-4-deoxy-L-arabinose transferase-like glycosyltransferase